MLEDGKQTVSLRTLGNEISINGKDTGYDDDTFLLEFGDEFQFGRQIRNNPLQKDYRKTTLLPAYDDKYQLIDAIGMGGASVVWQVRSKVARGYHAAKVGYKNFHRLKSEAHRSIKSVDAEHLIRWMLTRDEAARRPTAMEARNHA
ncbi:hypothetical protein FRB96_007916 [Tulasnella sp. 330]|nr:hypothetical protein FRB96_007916 [Tulasnella sp. 330]